MSGKIYALLVGINDYKPKVGRLRGCVRDVHGFHDYLKTAHGDRLEAVVLENADATRDRIVEQFREHLGRAGKDDVALFNYCGHGARWRSAPEFEPFYPDGFDEGLVCADSRIGYPYDLADKELAVLLHEVARNEPHLAVVLDCCHSGSATRGVDDFTLLGARQTHTVDEPRPLDSYLDGYYAKRRQAGDALTIPGSRHILLAACDRMQKARELRDSEGNIRGVFSNTLQDVLGRSGGAISYADLFLRCRATIRVVSESQDPRFESHEGFNVHRGFLGESTSGAALRYSVYFNREQNVWKLESGAVHGLPSEPEKAVELRLYEDDGQTPAGTARTAEVGAQESVVELELTGGNADDRRKQFLAEVCTLPVDPLLVAVEGDDEGKRMLREGRPPLGVALTDEVSAAPYSIVAEADGGKGRFVLRERNRARPIETLPGLSTESAQSMVHDLLPKIAKWERLLALENRSTELNHDDIDFWLTEELPGGQRRDYRESELTLLCNPQGSGWKVVPFAIHARNGSDRELHFTLLYFSQRYKIQELANEPVAPGKEIVLVDMGLQIDEKGANASEENFKLIVSSSRVNTDSLVQADLGTRMRGLVSMKKVRTDDWLTKSFRVRLLGQRDAVGTEDLQLAGGRVAIKGHRTLRASVSLTGVDGGSRSAGSDIHTALERSGLELLDFSATRSADGARNHSVLELKDIQQDDDLGEQPLEITLDLPVTDDESILPLTFDGEDFLLAGDVERDDDGRTIVRIDNIPESRIPDGRRSLGKALKLYFFKTYLRRPEVNRLCWVETREDGSVERHPDGVAEKVGDQRTKRVLLLIHGIIGDTQGIAEGLRQVEGEGLDRRFDLVLTYDYENLKTSIQDTAAQLEQDLHAVGLHENDDKHLTVLAHSMGGLLSRFFIERGSGRAVVDHLVMCGTPNDGSPFGKIGGARSVLNVLTTVAINVAPALAPYGGLLLWLAKRSKNLTRTLEQMLPDSEFFDRLGNEDPGIPYTILAGDVARYDDGAEGLLGRLLTKAGRGVALDALFGGDDHDIAASVRSIRSVPDARQPAPVKREVECHHLNYFASEAGLRALGEIDW